MRCGRCAGERFTKAGRDRAQRQLYRCRACGRRLTARTRSGFSGYRFPDEAIALAVRWYLRFRLSYVEVAEWLATDGHQAYRRAIQEPAPQARHMVTGLHQARGYPTTQPIERSHVPIKDRVRPMWRPTTGWRASCA